MSAGKHTPGPWQVRRSPERFETAIYYHVCRVVNRRRVHLKYASDGRPMLYSLASARAAIAKATGAAA